MAEPSWNQFLTERDKQVFDAAGYGARAGFGHRPALLVIDVNYNFCGDRSEPILESIKRWRNSCGAEAWDGVARIRELIDVAHAQGVPVIYTTEVRRRPPGRGGEALPRVAAQRTLRAAARRLTKTPPDLLRRQRHVDVADPEGREGVHDGGDERRRRHARAGFADALRAQRVER